MLLLDTCTLVWLALKRDELSERAIGLLMQHPAEVYVSAITALDLAMAVRKGRLQLQADAEDWFYEQLEGRGIREIPVTNQNRMDRDPM